MITREAERRCLSMLIEVSFMKTSKEQEKKIMDRTARLYSAVVAKATRF